MRQCAAITKAGQACAAPAGASGYCFTHDPSQAAARAAARMRGGLNRRGGHGGDLASVPAEIRSLSAVLSLLDYVRGELVSMDNGIARARALISLAAQYSATITAGELESRIAALEAQVFGGAK